MASILVVDDDPGVQQALAEMLAAGGHHVMLARLGREALEDVRTLEFDLLGTDIVMPEVDGWRLIRALRECKPAAAVIAVSGGAVALEPDVALRLSAAFGAHGVMRKPIRKDALLKMVAEVMAALSATQPPIAEGGTPA